MTFTRKRLAHFTLLLCTLAFLMLTGCASSVRTVEKRVSPDFETRTEIPLEELRVYHTRTPILIETQDGRELYGYPLDVAKDDYILLSTNWSYQVEKVQRIDWPLVKKVYLVDALYDAEMTSTYVSAPLLVPVISAISGIFGFILIIGLIVLAVTA